MSLEISMAIRFRRIANRSSTVCTDSTAGTRSPSSPLGILIGLVISAAIAYPFAIGHDPATGNQYFWEIMIPGAIVGAIVGYATQVYGGKPRAV